MNGMTRDLNKTRLRGQLETIIHDILTEWNIEEYKITKKPKYDESLTEVRELEYNINIKLTR